MCIRDRGHILGFAGKEEPRPPGDKFHLDVLVPVAVVGVGVDAAFAGDGQDVYKRQPLNRLLLDWADKKHSLSVRKITRADYLEWMLQWPPRLP